MRKGLVIVLVFVLVNFALVFRVSAEFPVADNKAMFQRIQLEQERAMREATLHNQKQVQEEKNWTQQFIDNTSQLRSIITAAQWAQATVKGIQDQLSFFNDVRNYIESVEDSITSVADMYDTIQNAGEDIDKTKTMWNRLMKGNYNDVKGIKAALSEAASLADNLDDHAAQLEQDAINVSQKARAHDKALDAMLRKAREINPLKAADPTLALLVKLNLMQGTEEQKMFAEKIYVERLRELEEEMKKVEAEKQMEALAKEAGEYFGNLKPVKVKRFLLKRE